MSQPSPEPMSSDSTPLPYALVPQRAPGARPAVIAHRGSSGLEPEHTRAAYLRAAELPVQGWECDVRLSMDGEVVCTHDRTVDRTSNGTGVVSTMTLPELQALRWGDWKDISAPDAYSDADRNDLLTLRELLGMVVDHPQRVELAIETKHPVRFGGKVERYVIELLEHFGLTGMENGRLTEELPQVRIMSFSARAVSRVRALAPGVPVVFLKEVTKRTWVERFSPADAALGIDVAMIHVNPQDIRDIRRTGKAVHVWTADAPEDIAQCVAVGVDAIITNRPAEVLTYLDSLDPAQFLDH